STSVNTNSVDTGFELVIASSWDNSTVYADVDISLTDVIQIDDFDFASTGTGSNATSTTIQLPQTSERELTTQVRIRPGDSLLIAGLVRENDNFSTSGPGFMQPVLPTSRTAQTDNLELVFLLRPKVVVYTSPEDGEHYNTIKGSAVKQDNKSFDYDFAPFNEQGNSADAPMPLGNMDASALDPGAVSYR
ncbi:MAG: hypothetical protein VXW91_00175, partial [Pseudomonadota bacterium]|nr:hypothetical protein [Pseudomonadota bacterium]